MCIKIPQFLENERGTLVKFTLIAAERRDAHEYDSGILLRSWI
jgi:hypothetical protein